MARGSIIRRNGRYGYRIDLGADPSTGKRRQSSKQGFRTKREAERALDTQLASLETGTVVGRSAVTVERFLEDWLGSQRARLKETSWASYKLATDRVKARLGKVKLQALTPMQIEIFYSDLAVAGTHSKRPLSAKTIRNTHTVLRKALSDAERLGLVNRNAAASAKPPVPQYVAHRTWSVDEVRQFLARTEHDRLVATYVLLVTTGMRRGEALGLRWRDLDLHASEVAVVQTLTTVGTRTLISTPKTASSRRVIYLDESTVNTLRSHRSRQNRERLAIGADWTNEGDFVFTDELGEPLHPDWLTREFKRVAKSAGLPLIRLHDLRHTYATLALKGGVHPKIVSERLGHATVAITLDLYSHVTPAIAREAADVVADQLFAT